MNSQTIENKKELRKFIAARKKAIKEKKEFFYWKSKAVLIDYAHYVIEYAKTLNLK